MRSALQICSTIARSAFAVLAFSGLTLSSQAAVQSRISTAVDETSRAALSHTVNPRAAAAQDLGLAPSSLKLNDMTMRFTMTEAQQAALSKLLLDQQNPASPLFHQWLTPQQFGAQFGLSASDLAKVASWLSSQGFTITSAAKSSTFITFNGTATQVQQAFGTSIHSLSLHGEQHVGNLAEPTLPAALVGVVNNITGLSDFKLKSRVRRSQIPASTVHADNTVTLSDNTTAHYIAPGDFYTIYDVKPLLTNSINGSGITIAVMGQVDFNATSLADIAAFRSASSLSATPPTIQLVGTDPGAPTASCIASGSTTCVPSVDDLDESLLDVEWSGAAAPSAKILFVNSTDVIDVSLVQAIDQKLATIMTVSYGNCEANYSTAQRDGLNQSFQQANAEGITIFGPTGDAGATDCDSGVASATQGLAVDFPASSPYVTAVGGTMFSGDATNSASYWNTANGTNGGSAIAYIPEAIWNETTLDLTSSDPGFGAGGGGASSFYAKPAWQTGTGVPNDFSRDVPDVSLNAAADHDGYLVCAQSSCSGGTFFPASSTADFNVFGGTSVSTPAFAGLLALVEQKLGSSTGLGNVNPNIYALANSSTYNSIFHDVTTGNNDSPCTINSTNCTTSPIGYSAGTGYDLASGWGSVDASVLANTWGAVSPTISGSLAISTTTVSTTTSSVTAGTSIPLTIAVTSGTTGTAATPSGSIQVLVDGTAVASSSTSLVSGAASYSLVSTSLTSGAHTVTAVYSGDSNYGASKGTVSIDIISASAADFTLTPATASISLASGASSTGTTFTVTPKNGFVGTIAFTSAGGINATYSATPSAVTIASGTTSAATVYAIQAFVANAVKGQMQLKLASNLNRPRKSQPFAPWYAMGSGSMLACLVLFAGPRRRRLGGLLAVLLSTAALSVVGCSSSSSTSTAGTTVSTQTNTTAGTYAVTFTATGTPTSGAAIAHTATITVIVQ